MSQDRPKGRGTKVATFTGVTGTGKSYLAKQKAKKLSNEGKVLVLTYTGSGTSWDNCKKIAPTAKALSFRRGWRKIHVAEWEDDKENDLFKAIFKHYKNGLIILDDCRMYLEGNWENIKGLKHIFNDHRHLGLDVFLIAHAPNHIPRQLWAYVQHSFVFGCTFNFKKNELNCSEPEKFMAAQAQVNKKFKQKSKEANKKVVGIYKYIRL